jgi:hypothetical protein
LNANTEMAFFSVYFPLNLLKRWEKEFNFLRKLLSTSNEYTLRPINTNHYAFAQNEKIFIWRIILCMNKININSIELDVKILELLNFHFSI